MRDLKFPKADLQRSDHDRFSHPCPQIQKRMDVLRLAAHGLPRNDIVRLSGLSRASVQRRLDAVTRWNYKGRPSPLQKHATDWKTHFETHPPATVAEARRVPEIRVHRVGRKVSVTERAVTNLLERYDELLAVSLGDDRRLKKLLAKQGRVILAIDGFQPDVGHEVLWVIRECPSGEILLAKSLLSARQEDWAGLLSAVRATCPVPVGAVVSDGQHSIRKAVAEVFPGGPGKSGVGSEPGRIRNQDPRRGERVGPAGQMDPDPARRPTWLRRRPSLKGCRSRS